MSTVVQAPPGGNIQETATMEANRYLTFTLNEDSYALDIFHILEILEHRHLTVVPMMPSFIRGVINLRGRAVPVIDLAIRFGRGRTQIARRTSVIIVHINEEPVDGPGDSPAAGGSTAPPGAGQDIGILVDSVNKVVSFTAADIEPAPAFGGGIRTDYISGMAKRDHDFIIVLEIDRVLSLRDMASIAATAAADASPDGADPPDRRSP